VKIVKKTPASSLELSGPKCIKFGKDTTQSLMLQVCFRFYINCCNAKRQQKMASKSSYEVWGALWTFPVESGAESRPQKHAFSRF